MRHCRNKASRLPMSIRPAGARDCRPARLRRRRPLPCHAVAHVELNQRQTLILAILVLFVGRWLNRHVAPLREWNIPEPVTGGVLASVAFGVALSRRRHPGFVHARLARRPADRLLHHDRPFRQRAHARCRGRHARGADGHSGRQPVDPGWRRHWRRASRSGRIPRPACWRDRSGCRAATAPQSPGRPRSNRSSTCPMPSRSGPPPRPSASSPAASLAARWAGSSSAATDSNPRQPGRRASASRMRRKASSSSTSTGCCIRCSSSRSQSELGRS